MYSSYPLSFLLAPSSPSFSEGVPVFTFMQLAPDPSQPVRMPLAYGSSKFRFSSNFLDLRSLIRSRQKQVFCVTTINSYPNFSSPFFADYAVEYQHDVQTLKEARYAILLCVSKTDSLPFHVGRLIAEFAVDIPPRGRGLPTRAGSLIWTDQLNHVILGGLYFLEEQWLDEEHTQWFYVPDEKTYVRFRFLLLSRDGVRVFEGKIFFFVFRQKFRSCVPRQKDRHMGV